MDCHCHCHIQCAHHKLAHLNKLFCHGLKARNELDRLPKTMCNVSCAQAGASVFLAVVYLAQPTDCHETYLLEQAVCTPTQSQTALQCSCTYSTALLPHQLALHSPRIIAGPGSGKTRVLTSRVEYLIKEKECKPWEMVVITFSNKAARELQDRLTVLLGPEVGRQIIAGVSQDPQPSSQ